MTYFVSKIIWVTTGKVDDLNDLVRHKNRRAVRAFLIGQNYPYLIFKLFRVIHFFPQDWERHEEPAAPVGNLL